MNNPTNHYPSVSPETDAISLVEIANMLLRNWRLVAVLPVLLAVGTGVWSITRDRTYAVSVSFMPQAAETGGATGAAALAQQFGVRLGADRPGESPQFYIDLVRGRTLLRQAVEADYQVPTDNGRIWKGTLIQYWGLNQGRGSIPPWRRATETLHDDISASISRETGVVRLTVSSDNPILAEQIAERLLELLNKFNLEVRRSRAEEEGRFIRGRLSEAQSDLLAAEGALQDFLRQNREFRNSPDLMFGHDRLQRQVIMRQEMYTLLLRSQEQTRIDAVRDTPLFTVIDHPTGTAEPEGRGTVRRVTLAFILGLLLAVLITFVREFARRRRETEDPPYGEFQSLARQAWNDLKHPRRWVRGSAKPRAVGDR